MTSRRQTLSEYIQKRQSIKHMKKSFINPTNTVFNAHSQKQSQLMEIKKNKITTLMSKILNQVKKSTQNQHLYHKLQEIIQDITQELTKQFKQVGNFIDSRNDTLVSQKNYKSQCNIIVHNQKFEVLPRKQQNNMLLLQSQQFGVLEEIKQNKEQKDMKLGKTANFGHKQPQKLKIKRIMPKERSRKSKQNYGILENINGNPEQDTDYSAKSDILNKAFDRKEQQRKLQSQQSTLKQN